MLTNHKYTSLVLAGVIWASGLLTEMTPAVAAEAYVVVSGDTACEVAESFSVPCASLIEANQLGADGLIFVGQRLLIPSAESDSKKDREPAVIPETKPPVEPKIVQPSEEAAIASDMNQSAPTIDDAVDLFSLYTEARDNDPALGAQEARRDAAKQAIPQARAAMRPQLSFDSNLARTYDDDFQESDSLRTSVSLTQSLYSPLSSITLRQAKYQIAAAEADHREAEQDLILRVARAYFSALTMTDNLLLSEKNQAAIGRQLELAQQRLRAGLGTRTDLFDAEARYEGAVADGIEAAKLLDDSNQALMLITGRNLSALRKLRSDDQLKSPVPNDPGPWIDAALSVNNKLVAERHNLSILRLEAEKKRAARMPTLGASLTGSFNDTEKLNTTQTTFALRLSVPILKGGLMRAQIKEADLNLRAAYSNYEFNRRQVQIETRGAFLAISSSLRRIEALAGAVRAGESALRAKEEGLAAGLNTNIEVLNGQRDLFLAEFNYLKERYDCVIRLLELEALVGGLTEEDVHRVNAWLESGQ